MTSHSKSIGINMELVPLCSYSSFHSFGKDFYKIVKCVSVGIVAHSVKRAFVRSGTDVGRELLADNQHHPKEVPFLQLSTINGS